MVFKFSGLINQLKSKLGFGASEPSEPIIPHDDSPMWNSTSERSAQLQQLSLRGSSERAERRIDQADKVNADAPPNHSQAKKSVRGSKPEMPKRQRWRRSAVRAAKKVQGLERR